MNRPPKWGSLFLIVVGVVLLALFLYLQRRGATKGIDNLLISLSSHIQKQFYFLGSGTRRVLDHYVWLVNTKTHNEGLEKEVQELRSLLAQFNEVRLENERLRHNLQFRESVQNRLIPAHIMAHDVSSDFLGVRIDRGEKDGVQVGMGVISAGGVVGRILRATIHTADVRTLMDPGSNIDAVIQRSRVRGILSGQSRQLMCEMKYVDKLDDVLVNDLVVSSGFGGIFPKGLMVGYVTSVMPSNNGVLQTVSVKSAVDIHRLEEVFIVVPSTSPEKDS